MLTKLDKPKSKSKRPRKRKLNKRKNDTSAQQKTPEKQYDHYVIQGSTFEKCCSKHENINLEGCGDAENSQITFSKDISDKGEQRSFEIKQEKKCNELEDTPQNIRIVLNLDDDWNFESVLLGDENGNSESPWQISNIPTNETECNDPHFNQISWYECAICNPSSYKDYEHW